ncbi:4a-hydroxytetrahydrobiopterin dehydratase [Marinobacter nanhaiticus D15-8W]|uniref:Putative pterin-4-alpha-carbinolamine dehydratase n=1 Tax=Marinobacter nanhaiticus D15-8W TaxID=626887 RepID=N6WTQ5_9GAMM|nr:4a-hydroxytetrahydrobiopterin dehydratase [Marinobacter nanhaiticus]ENO14422.1 4a-hydroxytetrahydrobiopterin dehydratase [Marinobacter nanhaiticus D15-8W]BES71812.1 4a-hydroxytetrahydrobiopterin dehydratase [Marinobacter nanhaiticus D15-8W]
MTELKSQSCEACKADAPQVTGDELASLQKEVPEWALVEKGGEQQIERTFKFKNFAEALTFTNKVGDLAEAEGHHPALLTEYGKTTVNWWTHKIGGLHRNDFIMAARTDELFGE